MMRAGALWLALACLVGFASAVPEFDQDLLNALTDKLTNIREDYFLKFGSYIGHMSCSDVETGELLLQLTEGDIFLTIRGRFDDTQVNLKKALDFDSKADDNQNNREYEFTCTNTATGSAKRFAGKILVDDVNDNAPFFVRTGDANATFQVQIPEFMSDSQLQFPIYDAITVQDIDGVDNNVVEAVCERIETNQQKLRCEGSGLFSVQEKQITRGFYRFSVYALRTTYSDFTDFVLVIKAMNIPRKDDGISKTLNSTSQNVLITIKDVQNLNPEFNKNNLDFSMPESRNPITEVEQGRYIIARDQDVRDPNPIRFELARNPADPSGFDEGYFEVGPVTVDSEGFYNAQFLLKKKIDREEAKTVTVNIRAIEYAVNASDPSRNPGSAEDTITVRILDVNDERPKFNEPVYNISVNERNGPITEKDIFVQFNSNQDMQIEDLDSDVYSRFGVEIIEGNLDEMFRLNIKEGVFREGILLFGQNSILDYEVGPNQYKLVLKATDLGNAALSSTATIFLEILDLNDNRPEFNQRSYKFQVAENTPLGTFVGTIGADDLDSGIFGDIREYRILDQSGKFVVDRNTGVITTNGDINFEAQATYTFTATAVDGGGEETSVLVTIKVNNLDDLAPLFTANYSAQLFEDAVALSQQLIIEAINREGGGTIVTYAVDSISPPTIPMGTFVVGPTDGVVTVTQGINYQDTVNGIVKVTFKATTGSLSAFTTATIEIIDRNNFNPTFDQNTYQVEISENANAGSLVIDLNVTDRDGPTTLSGQYEFSLVQGANDAFTIGRDSGRLTVARNNQLDFNNQKVYEIVVRARDKGIPPLASTAIVTVTLRDANNKPPAFDRSLYLFQMKESDQIGDMIDQVSATDMDSDSQLRYSIAYETLVFEKKTQQVQTQIDGTKVLSIDEFTGTLRVAGAIDRSVYDRCSLNVLVTDENAVTSGQIGTASVFITILASVNPEIYFSPPWTKENPVISKTYSEAQTYNYQILTLKATDPTIPASINNYQKQPGSDPGNFFEIRNSFVYLMKPLDYEMLGPNKQVSVVVRAISDSGDRTATATVVVNVQDLNDNAPQFEKQIYVFNVTEDSRYPYELGFVRATDADRGSLGDLTYLLAEGSDFGVYTIRTGLIYEARLFVAANKTLDYETIPEYNLQLTAEDNYKNPDGVQLRSTVNVQINVLDVNDHSPEFRENVYEFSVVGTKEVNEEVGIVLANDLDTGLNGRVTYSILSGTNSGTDYFKIDDDIQTTANINKVSTFGVILVKSILEDLQDRTMFELKVIGTDLGLTRVFTGTTTVRITVSKGVQDPKPKWTPGVPDRVQIQEHSTLGTFVATVTASPANETSSILYKFVEGGNAAGDFLNFNIDEVTGRITVARDLDYEEEDHYTLLILATDSSNASLTNQHLLVVEILDINDNTPSFKECRDKQYGIPEIASVMEDKPAPLYTYTVRACDNDEYPNNMVVYSWFTDNSYCNPNVQDVFNLDSETGVITTKILLDREDKSMYLLCIEASPRTRRKRDMVSDLKARDNHDTVLYVQVNVLDANDNGPRFPVDIIKKVIMQYPQRQVSVAEAFDADQLPYNLIRYSIENITFTSYGKTMLAPTAFSINARDGTITAGTNDFKDYIGGYFDIHIKAEDRNKPSNPFTRQVQTVYVSTKASQIRVVFEEPASSGVEDKARQMIQELNDLEDGVYYEVKKISYHIVSNDQDPVFDKTDVCLVVVRDESVLPAVTAAKRLGDVRSVEKVLNSYGAVEPGPCDPARSIYPEGWESYWWVLVAFAIFIFVCVCILIVMVVMLYRSYKRYMNTRKTYLVEATPM